MFTPKEVFEGVGGGGSDAGFNAQPSEGRLPGVRQLSLLQQVQAGQDVGNVVQPPHLRLQLVCICTGALCLCRQGRDTALNCCTHFQQTI